jgi:hypothetical protein
MNYDELGEKLDEKIEKKVKKEKKGFEPESPEDIKDILQMVGSEVPSLIKNIFTAIYDPEIASNYGQGIVALYEQLKDKGMPEEMVEKIVMNFSKSFDIVGKAMSNINVEKED